MNITEIFKEIQCPLIPFKDIRSQIDPLDNKKISENGVNSMVF